MCQHDIFSTIKDNKMREFQERDFILFKSLNYNYMKLHYKI